MTIFKAIFQATALLIFMAIFVAAGVTGIFLLP